MIRACIAVTLLVFCACAQDTTREQKSKPSPGHQIGNGAANIGTGAAKGAGDLAKGTAKTAGNLVTLHPIDAGASMARGAGSAAKDVGVGTVKGTGKITVALAGR